MPIVGHDQDNEGMPGRAGSCGIAGNDGMANDGTPNSGHDQSSSGNAQLLTALRP